MPFNLNTFKQNALNQGGYRPSLFEVRITYAGENFSFLCQSSQVPAFTVNPIEVPYFGRTIKVAGMRTYAEWTTTLMVEEDFDVRRTLEQWNQNIDSAIGNLRNGIFSAENYKQDAEVILYGKTGNIVNRYFLLGCWPSDVGTIELDWNSPDTIGTYTVSWQFDFMNVGVA